MPGTFTSNLKKIRHLVRCKRKADRISGWKENSIHEKILAIKSSTCIHRYAMPGFLSNYVSKAEWQRFLTSRLYYTIGVNENVQFLSQVINEDEMAIVPLPGSILQNFVPKVSNIDFNKSRKLWNSKCREGFGNAFFRFRELMFGSKEKKNESEHVDAIIKGVPESSGPIEKKNKLSKYTLSNYLYEKLIDELDKEKVTVSSSSWSTGEYENGAFVVRNIPLKFPRLCFILRVLFLLNFICLLIKALYNYNKTEGCSLFFLTELTEALYASYCKEEDFPTFIFGTNTTMNRFGLYQLVLDKKGCRSVLLAYSTNDGSFLRDGVDEDFYNIKDVCSWPEHWCWNDAHKNILQDENIRRLAVKGMIPFTDSFNISLPGNKESYIALFDVPQHRELYITLNAIGIGGHDPYLTARNQFLKDVLEIASNLNLIVYYKVKRHHANNIDKNYIRLTREIADLNHIRSIDPDVSPMRIIENAKAVISYPFTTTALYANLMNIPGCYYDSLGKLYNPQVASLGIEIVQKKHNLRNWLIKSLN